VNRIRCVVIGLGRIGWKFEDDPLRPKPASHVGAIIENPACELVAGIDLNPGSRDLFEKRWGIPAIRRFEDIDHAKIDVVHICTPPDEHFATIAQCIQAGIRLIVCEKPITSSPDTTKQVSDMLTDSHTNILINYPRRFSGRYKYLRDVISARKYGRLLSIYGTICYGTRRNYAEMLRNDGTHLINILQFLTINDAPKIHHSAIAPTESGYRLTAELEFIGKPATILVLPGGGYLLFELSLLFETGRITINNETISEYASAPAAKFSHYHVLAPRATFFPPEKSSMSSLVESAVACIQGDYDPKPDFTSAVATVKIIEDILNLAKKHK
jgi:predicted dehydrogenase